MSSENCGKVSPLLSTDVGETTPACIREAIRQSALMFRRSAPEAQSAWVAANTDTRQISHVHFWHVHQYNRAKKLSYEFAKPGLQIK
jgi:hypothetical protein